MTEQIPGWYPDPADPGLVRWYDGRRWTLYTSDATETPTTWGRPAIGREWFTLSAVVQGGLATVVLADAAAILVLGRARDVLARLQVTPIDADVRSMASLLEFASTVRLLIVLAAVVTGIAFVSWLHRAHRSSALDTSRLRHGSGWTVGAWLVPLVNLWLPYDMVQDVHRGARSGRDSLLVLSWWLTLTLSAAIGLAAWLSEPPAGATGPADLVAAGEAGLLAMVGYGVNLIAAVLAILVVQQVRAAVRDRLTQPVVRPASAVTQEGPTGTEPVTA